MYWELLPELPLSHRNGKTYLAPAEAYDPEKKWNVEPVELYAVFPFRLFGFAKENYDLILDTFYSAIKEGGQDRPFSIGETPGASSYSGWQSVGTCAALLGLSEKCGEILSQNCALTNPGTRFPAMWGPIYDAVPDVDHGANILTQLQTMVMQVEGSKIYILPAFPDKWNVSFRLYADKDTVVEASYRDGKLKDVSVEPKIRQKDLVLLKEEG